MTMNIHDDEWKSHGHALEIDRLPDKLPRLSAHRPRHRPPRFALDHSFCHACMGSREVDTSALALALTENGQSAVVDDRMRREHRGRAQTWTASTCDLQPVADLH